MPELALPFAQIDAAKKVFKTAPTNTLFVFGVSGMTDEQVIALEPALSKEKNCGLWGGPRETKLANCAVVAVGQSEALYLQPKLVQSRFENDLLWCGNAVRYFKADGFRFIVLICSDLLDAPEHRTVPAAIVDEIRNKEGALELCVWLQYNEKPRSRLFLEGIGAFRRSATTVLTVNTRRPGPKRFENFGVSGALVPQEALPAEASVLTKRFHYIEPLDDDVAISRMVLLRYDADIYRVKTVRADAVRDAGVQKGALFQESQPYVFRDGALEASIEHQHLIDLIHRASGLAQHVLAAAHPGLAEAVNRVTQLWTYEFMACLDVATVPDFVGGRVRHAAGEKHRDGEPEHIRFGDFLCHCWRHRECLDLLTHTDVAAEPAAELLRAVAIMIDSGLDANVKFDDERRTNVDVAVGAARASLGIIYVHPYNAAAARKAFRSYNGPANRPRVIDAPYIVFGTGDAPARTPLHEIKAARAGVVPLAVELG
jgi:hypothetical protein